MPSLTGIKAFAEDLVILTPQTVTEINDDFKASHPTAFMFGTICSYRQRFEDWLESEGIVPGRIVKSPRTTACSPASRPAAASA